MTDLGNNLADDRSELLRDQARARAVEHRRRQAERAAAKASPPSGSVSADPLPEPAPDRPLTAQERAEAAEMAQNRRTVWLATPVEIPGTQRRCFAYDPENVPAWLREVLDAQLAA